MHSNKMINQIRVYNALGEMIVQRNFQNTACELELAGFNNGVYVIQFKSADGFIYSKRIVKSDQ